MKSQIATTIEQSRRLLACGVDPKTADMSVRTIKEPYSEDMAWHIPKLLTLPYEEAKTIYGEDETTPAWSLSCLLGLLPNNIMAENHRQFSFCLCKSWGSTYIVAYGDENSESCHSNGETAVEACVRMIEFLTANGYSLNKTGE